MLQVGQLEAAAVEHSKQLDNLREELNDALAEVDEEKERYAWQCRWSGAAKTPKLDIRT